MRPFTHAVAVFLTIFTAVGSVKAERYWFSAGLGGGSAGFTVGTDYSSRFGPGFLSCRATASWKNIEIGFGSKPRENVYEAGLLYGLATTDYQGSVASFSIGVGIVDGVKQGKSIPTLWVKTYEEIRYSAVGLLLQSQLYTSGAVGLTLFGNINSENSFGGALLSFRFGRYK
ncbi:MAG: hypothetical protein JSU65_12355 [Candidatus Zixiibacteriota bacterium]|nr:MAG: hypothetical protein JSU65_12355 [candidate division Zixibacteria bacterium]